MPTSNRGCPSPADRRIAYDTLPKFKQLQMELREGAPFLLLAPANGSTPPLSRVGFAFSFWSYGAYGTLSLRSCASCAHWRHRQHLDLHANPVWAEIEWMAHVVEAQLAARRMAHRLPGRRCWTSAAPSATSLPQRIPGEVQDAPCVPYALFPAVSVTAILQQPCRLESSGRPSLLGAGAGGGGSGWWHAHVLDGFSRCRRRNPGSTPAAQLCRDEAAGELGRERALWELLELLFVSLPTPQGTASEVHHTRLLHVTFPWYVTFPWCVTFPWYVRSNSSPGSASWQTALPAASRSLEARCSSPKSLAPSCQDCRIKTSSPDHRRAKSPPHVLQGLARWLSSNKIKKKLPFDSKLPNKNLYLYKLLI